MTVDSDILFTVIYETFFNITNLKFLFMLFLKW